MKKLIILAFFAILGMGLIAQAPPPPPSDPSKGGTNGPVGAPIDGGLSVFVAFAVGMAGNEWRKRLRKQN